MHFLTLMRAVDPPADVAGDHRDLIRLQGAVTRELGGGAAAAGDRAFVDGEFALGRAILPDGRVVASREAGGG